MNTSVNSLRDTIVPKSDQLNADQLITGPITITVTSVSRGSSNDQPVIVHYEGENGRPFKPCKSMRRVLILTWGDNGADWVGRSMTLYNEPSVKFGGVQVGGIRISHMSHIEGDKTMQLTATRGKKEPFTVRKLIASDAPDIERYKAQLQSVVPQGVAALGTAWRKLPETIIKQLGSKYRDELKAKAAEHDAKRATANTAGTLNSMASDLPPVVESEPVMHEQDTTGDHF